MEYGGSEGADGVRVCYIRFDFNDGYIDAECYEVQLMKRLLLLFALAAPGFATVSWVQNFQDNFVRTNSATVGNGWTDAAGVWSIASNNLSATTTNTSGFGTNFLTRPSGEAAQDQRAIFNVNNLNSTNTTFSVLLRRQAGSNLANYNFNLTAASGGGIILYHTNSSGTSVALLTAAPTLNTTDAYQIDCSASGVSPTTLTFIITDVSTSTVAFNQTITDSTADLQNATGVPGLLIWAINAGSAAVTSANFQTFHNPGAALSLSPATYTGNGSVTVTVTGTSTSFTGTPFTVAGTPTASITAQIVSSGTAGSVTIAVGSYVGNLTITDTISGAQAILQVFSPPLGILKICYIGDSILLSPNGGNAVGVEGSTLTSYGYTVTQNNQSISGQSSFAWANSVAPANLAAAVASCQASGDNIAEILLGGADTYASTSYTPAQHTSYMSIIANALVAGGMKVVIHKPLWLVPGTSFGGVYWPLNVNTTYQQYYVSDVSNLVNGSTIFAGDTAAFSYFEVNPTSLMDGAHPTAAANPVMGTMFANSLLKSLHLQGGGTVGFASFQ